MASQLNVRLEGLCAGPLGEIKQGARYGLGLVEDPVTVDVGGGTLETFGGAPFEQFVFVD